MTIILLFDNGSNAHSQQVHTALVTDRPHAEAVVETKKEMGSESCYTGFAVVRCTVVNARAAFPVLSGQYHMQSTSEHSSIR